LQKKVDFIIVGQGIAGTILAFELLKRNQTVQIIDNIQKNSSSRIALGIYNPLVLKWFTKSWEAEIQLKALSSFCTDFEEEFKIKINHKKNIYKFLDSNYAINNWTEKQSSPNRKHFMSEELKYLDGIKNPFGVVLQSGWIDTKLMLDSFRSFLKQKNYLKEEVFSYDKMKIKKDFIEYENSISKYIIFCEGASVIKNPYFNNLGFKMTKGEIIHFQSADLKINNIVHSGVITIPISNDTYYAGATFNWDTNNLVCSEGAKKEILGKIKKIKNFNYQLIDQKVGIRPSVTDRRAIIGCHKKHKSLYLMNGLGSRGMLLSPYLAKQLCSHILENKKINSEIDINRFQ
tara:strand:+ start:289 stop:1326 length:1038 start_codon:yes stop_codon:yes gene_type:complete